MIYADVQIYNCWHREMKIDPDKNVRLSSDPIMFDIGRLANEAHTEAFQDIFVAVVSANRDLFPSGGEIKLQSRHPLKSTLGTMHTVEVGKKHFETTLRVAEFLSDLHKTALILYQSDNDTVDLHWNLGEKPLHLMMAFDNPYFVMKE